VSKQLEDAQLAFQKQPFNLEMQSSIASLRKKAFFLNEAERLFFWQQAKCFYIKFSDRSSKFFHDIVKRNSRRNFIAAVIKEDGEITKSNEDLAGEFLRFYQDLLGFAGYCEPIDVNVLRGGPTISE